MLRCWMSTRMRLLRFADNENLKKIVYLQFTIYYVLQNKFQLKVFI